MAVKPPYVFISDLDAGDEDAALGIANRIQTNLTRLRDNTDDIREFSMGVRHSITQLRDIYIAHLESKNDVLCHTCKGTGRERHPVIIDW